MAIIESVRSSFEERCDCRQHLAPRSCCKKIHYSYIYTYNVHVLMRVKVGVNVVENQKVEDGVGKLFYRKF